MNTITKRPITAEDLYEFEIIFNPRLAPDGQQVVYSQQWVDRKTEKKHKNLWVVNTSTGQPGEPQRFTHGNQVDSSPEWSPDGQQIAFLSDRGNPDRPAQIYLIPIHGGEARPLRDIEGEINSILWSPDGSRLLCTVRKTDPEVVERREDEHKKELGVVARHYDRVFYKLDGYGYLPKERTHLWTVDTHSGEAVQLTDHPVFDEDFPTWSPDGQWIAFLSNRSDEPDFNVDAIDLYVMPSTGGAMRRIPTPPGEKSRPVFSPDGHSIAYYAKESEAQDYKNTGLWVVPADGSQAPRNLTEPYDLHVDAWTINDLGQPEIMPPTWSLDSQTLYFPVTRHGRSVLLAISSGGSDLKTVIDEEGVVGSFSFDRDQKSLAYFFGTMDDPGQVFWRDETGSTHQLTQVNRPLLDELDLGQVETVWIQGIVGNDLQGWILKPPGFDPAQKYPSILEIHGGPLTQYGYYFMHEFYYLAAQGYVVHFCNPRGGRGYGEAHAKAIWGGWGGADYDDIMAWTDFVAGQPYIDPDRMGVTGGSYGGYMTAWIIGHTQRYRAAVAQRCVSNLISMWGSSDFNWVFQQELNNQPPFEDLQKFWDHSPMKYIGNAKTPTLVIHSENDLRCPIEQGEQLFVGLKKLGVDSEMVRFPNEFHGLSRTGRTDRRIVRLNHIRRWFDKFMQDKNA